MAIRACRAIPHRLTGRALAAIGIDLDTVRDKIEAAFGPGALRPTPPETRRSWRRLRTGCRSPATTGHIPFTPRAKRCSEQSLREALALHSGYLGVRAPELRAQIIDLYRRAS